MSDLPPARKSLGQHWLEDEASLDAICSAADLGESDTVLEIGPGPGALTRLLTDKADKVVAVELDETLAAELPGRVKADNLQTVQADILHFDFERLPAGYKLVANIPYYLTGKLLRILSESSNPPSLTVLLLQEEVAERAAAGPGHLSILGATAQFYWEVELGPIVPAAAFAPPPKVDSQVLILRRRTHPLFDDVEPAAFLRLIKIGFAQPRKTLLNNLTAGLALNPVETRALCNGADIDPGRRAQTLSLDEWRQLYKRLHS